MNHLRLLRPLLLSSAQPGRTSSLISSSFSTTTLSLLASKSAAAVAAPAKKASSSKLIPASRFIKKTPPKAAASLEEDPDDVVVEPKKAILKAAPSKASSEVKKPATKKATSTTTAAAAKKPTTKKPAAKKPATAAAKKPAAKKTSKKEAIPTTNLPLPLEPPSRRLLSVLRKGLTKTPREHWIPLPRPAVSTYQFHFTNRAASLSASWAAMSDSDKEKFVKLAEEDQKRYEKDLAEYFANRTPEQFYRQKVPSHIEKNDPLKMPKLPSNAYSIFVATTAKNVTNNLKEVAAKWAGMSEEEKKPYHVQAEAVQREFKKTWKEYKSKLPPFPQE